MFKYKRPDIQTGDLNKPIHFFVSEAQSGPEVGGSLTTTLFRCTAEVYESSAKDIDAHSTVSARNLITVKIRDTHGGYMPNTKHQFNIEHHNYRGTYNVIDVSPDNRDKGFMKIVGEWHG